MNKEYKSANDILKGYHGGEKLFFSPVNLLQYTEGVMEIAKLTESYWFLDIISSYQSKLLDESFQVWKLERDLSFTEMNGVKSVVQRKDSFKVVCEDGNGKILVTQILKFSDFKYDIYTVWCMSTVVLLPSEY